jgi:hypothetical protein
MSGALPVAEEFPFTQQGYTVLARLAHLALFSQHAFQLRRIAVCFTVSDPGPISNAVANTVANSTSISII